MTEEFYDVKVRAKVTRPVTDKVVYGEGTKQRYALKAVTEDGRGLTKFVSKDKFDAVQL